MNEYIFDATRLIQLNKDHWATLMRRKNELKEKCGLFENQAIRLEPFKFIFTELGRPLGKTWELCGDCDMSIYLIPRGSLFSWRTSKIEEIRAIKEVDDVVLINNFEDIVKLFCANKRYFNVNSRCEEGPNNINQFFSRCGRNVPKNLFGFEEFEKAVTLNDDGNSIDYVGYRGGIFIYIHFIST